MKSKSVVIVCGDPKSIFNEILIKALKNKILKNIKFPLVIIGSKKLLENYKSPVILYHKNGHHFPSDINIYNNINKFINNNI